MNDRKLTNLLKKFIMRGYSAKAVALAACLALLVTSVNITAFAVSGDITSTPNVEETLTEEIREEPAEETREKTREEDPEEVPEETGEEFREETGEETGEGTSGENQGEPQGEAQTESQEEPQGEDVSTSEEIAEEAMVAFNQSVTVDGVVITVTADEGVFPEGATVEAVKVTSGEENEVTEAIDEVRDEEKKVAASYTFDISIYDKEGKEIEPDTEKGSVKVTFKMEEIANENLETDVYHVEKTDDGLNVEGLYVDTEEGEEDEAAVETTAFSFYTVEFTYDELQYVLEGDKRVELSTVLDAVGIKENGEISGVEGSNDELFRPVFDEEETAWYIEAVKAFDTEQWLKVTISEIEYVIVVTDSQSEIFTVYDWSGLKEALDEKSNCTIKLGSDIKYSAVVGAANFLEYNINSSTITLDLNGYVLDGNNSGSVVTIRNGATLTLVDSNTTASHTNTSYEGLPVGGVITGGSNGHGAGILIQGGKLIMNAGTISGNYANNSGSGVCVGDSSNNNYSNPSEFIMNGGSITGNGNQSTQWGGGVCVGSGNKSNSTFTMNGGTISNNTSQDGGGVHVGGSGTFNTFNMTGGTISGNNSTGGGGGVSVYLYGNQTNYCFKMTGGTITDNTASGNGAGVNLRTGSGTGQLTIGGTAEITENTVGDVTNNLYLPEGKTISVGTGDDAPQSGMNVCVTTGKVPQNIGDAVDITSNGEKADLQYFHYDAESANPRVKLAYAKPDGSNGKIQLIIPVAVVETGSNMGSYASVRDAVRLAGNAETTIKLVEDSTETGSSSDPFSVVCIIVENGQNITLDLNGHELKSKDQSALNVIGIRSGGKLVIDDTSDQKNGKIMFSGPGDGRCIHNEGTLTVKNGTFTSNQTNAAWNGGAIYSAGTFNMTGGTITNNTAADGGGVYIAANGTFNMKDGTIKDNTANTCGGGVYHYGTFNMEGGVIEENKSINGWYEIGGGGVCTQGNATYTGGIIRNNSANKNAGGVLICNNNTTMSGVTIAGNTTGDSSLGGGVYIYGGTVCVGGNTQITGNMKGTTEQNVYLQNGQTLSIGTGSYVPKSGMSVGITTATAPTESNPVKISTNTDADYSRYFVSDDSAYTVKTDGNVLKLMIKVAEPDPTPAPKPDPQPEPSPDEPEPQPTVQPLPKTQYAETGMPAKNYLANNPTGSKIPLPYITTNAAKAGWQTIGEALDAHKAKYKNKAVESLSITTNGYATVDTKLIIDAHEKKIPLLFVLDDEVTVGIPVANTVLADRAKEGKTTYFKISAMTTAEAVSIKKMHAGLLPSDIVAIGGNENTPVVLTLCSNDKPSTGKSQLITITFNAKKAGFKKGDKVYIYCGTSLTGISMYKMAKVDKNGFVTFRVPMGGNYWTIGNKNMKNKLLRNG